jgi:hypothetical protein
VVGSLTGLLVTVKGLPSTYNKDLQEDKEPLFDTVETMAGCIPIATGVLSTLTPQPDKMAASLVPEMLATDLADYLVRRGVPFRQTHHIAGEAVRVAEEQGKPLDQLTLAELQQLHPAFEQDVQQGARAACAACPALRCRATDAQRHSLPSRGGGAAAAAVWSLTCGLQCSVVIRELGGVERRGGRHWQDVGVEPSGANEGMASRDAIIGFI